MFEKIKQKFLKNKSSLLKIAVFLGIYFLLSDLAFANNNSEQTKAFDKFIEILSQFGQFVSELLAVFLGLLTYLVSMFLSPEWTSGNIFNMGKYLKEVWILVSNVVYIVFAFLLIAIAFANITGFGGNFEMKQAIPKFIVGILIVPFSWFLVQLLVSVSSILTIAALNLPFDVFKNYSDSFLKYEIPTECVLTLGENKKEIKPYDCDKTKKKPLRDILKSSNGTESIFGLVSLYTYALIDLEGLGDIGKKDIKTEIKNLTGVGIKVIFDLFFVIAYSLLMIALGLALMVRGIRLWIFMMLSPLFGLMHFFKDKRSGFFEKFSIGQLVALAFVPVLAMLALSFGMLFIWIVGLGMVKGESAGQGGALSSHVNPNSIVTVDDKGGINIGEFKLKISGLAGASEKGELSNLFSTAYDAGVSAVGYLILKLFGIVILWGAFMAALEASNITKAVVEPIVAFGKNIGNAATSIPQYMPIIPGIGSLKTVSEIPRQLASTIEQKDSRNRQEFFKDIKLIDESGENLNNFNQTLRTLRKENTQVNRQKAYDELLGFIKSSPDSLDNRQFKDSYSEFQKLLGRKDFDYREIRFSQRELLRDLYNNVEKNSNLRDKAFGGNANYGLKATSEQDFILKYSGSVNPDDKSKTKTGENSEKTSGSTKASDNATAVAAANQTQKTVDPSKGDNNTTGNT